MTIRPLIVFLFISSVALAQRGPLAALEDWLAKDASERPALESQPFRKTVLDKQQAAKALDLLWKDTVAQLKEERADEFEKKELTIGDQSLRFDYRTFGEAPKDGHGLFISMHGGGGAPSKVNDQQWKNQIGLYEPKEGYYVAPRAPTNTWNLWHQSHIDPLFDRLIEDFVLLKEVNPNRIYLMGYSAGGDGVYQLAPRMSDRFAAAAMMAGHPNETKPEGLRNLPFTLHMGGDDKAYNRNNVAAN
jgi:poly(3-hydroxybutyrate) depolymerase